MSRFLLCLPVWIVLATLSPVHLSAQTGTEPAFDVDGDGTIASADILALVDHMRQHSVANRNMQFDLNESGAVDDSDIATLAERLRLRARQDGGSRQTAGVHTPHNGRLPFPGQTAGGPPLTSCTLVPQTPGPYASGSSVDVDVVLTNNEGQALQARLITLDFSATDGALSLPSTFHFQLVPPLVSDSSYLRLEMMPKVDIVYGDPTPTPGLILDIPDGASLTLGTVTVGLPASYGSYFLDVINSGVPDTNDGARVDYGFDAGRITLHTLNQNLTGSPLELVVAGCLSELDCDDSRACTIDSCDPTGNCVHDQIPGCIQIPATSDWGLGVMLLLAACVGTIVFARRQRFPA